MVVKNEWGIWEALSQEMLTSGGKFGNLEGNCTGLFNLHTQKHINCVKFGGLLLGKTCFFPDGGGEVKGKGGWQKSLKSTVTVKFNMIPSCTCPLQKFILFLLHFFLNLYFSFF